MKDPFENQKKQRLLAALDLQPRSWRPAVDVYRDPGTWLCKFDLAGVERDDVELCVHGRRLVVTGVRRDRTLCAGRRAYSLEIAYHRFERTVELPCALEEAEISCVFRDGMLLVTITECPRVADEDAS